MVVESQLQKSYVSTSPRPREIHGGRCSCDACKMVFSSFYPLTDDPLSRKAHWLIPNAALVTPRHLSSSFDVPRMPAPQTPLASPQSSSSWRPDGMPPARPYRVHEVNLARPSNMMAVCWSETPFAPYDLPLCHGDSVFEKRH